MTVLVESSVNAGVVSAFQCQDLKERELGADKKDGKPSKGWKMLQRCCTSVRYLILPEHVHEKYRLPRLVLGMAGGRCDNLRNSR